MEFARNCLVVIYGSFFCDTSLLAVLFLGSCLWCAFSIREYCLFCSWKSFWHWTKTAGLITFLLAVWGSFWCFLFWGQRGSVTAKWVSTPSRSRCWGCSSNSWGCSDQEFGFDPLESFCIANHCKSFATFWSRSGLGLWTPLKLGGDRIWDFGLGPSFTCC